jgi:hypothetical protein
VAAAAAAAEGAHLSKSEYYNRATPTAVDYDCDYEPLSQQQRCLLLTESILSRSAAALV